MFLSNEDSKTDSNPKTLEISPGNTGESQPPSRGSSKQTTGVVTAGFRWVFRFFWRFLLDNFWGCKRAITGNPPILEQKLKDVELSDSPKYIKIESQKAGPTFDGEKEKRENYAPLLFRFQVYIYIYIYGPASLGTPPLPPPHGYGSV